MNIRVVSFFSITVNILVYVPFAFILGYLLGRWEAPVAQEVKNPAMYETWVPSVGWEDPPEEEMATYYSILAWKIP